MGKYNFISPAKVAENLLWKDAKQVQIIISNYFSSLPRIMAAFCDLWDNKQNESVIFSIQHMGLEVHFREEMVVQNPVLPS